MTEPISNGPRPAPARPTFTGGPAGNFGLPPPTGGEPAPAVAVTQAQVELGARRLLQALNQARLPAERPAGAPERDPPGLALYRAVRDMGVAGR